MVGDDYEEDEIALTILNCILSRLPFSPLSVSVAIAWSNPGVSHFARDYHRLEPSR